MPAPTTSGRRAVFLDRDGVLVAATVIDGRPYPPPTLAEFTCLPDARAALDALKRAGFLLIVATNQPDIATGKQTRDVLDAMHRRLAAALPVDEILTCCHTDADRCGCRKPKPGMLTDAASRWPIDLARSYMVGDRWRDVGAGAAAGCRTVFIERGYRETLTVAPDHVVASMAAAAKAILAESDGHQPVGKVA